MNWALLIGKLINLLLSSFAVSAATYGTSNSVEGAVVAGLGSAVNHLRENPLTSGLQSPTPTGGVGQLKMFVFLIIFLMAFPIMGNAVTTLEWDRNTETDMASYQVYGCFTAGCTFTKIPSYRVTGALISQTVVGVKPTWAIPAGKLGTVGVTAIDTSGNESPLSILIPIDSLPPSIPKTLVIKDVP